MTIDKNKEEKNILTSTVSAIGKVFRVSYDVAWNVLLFFIAVFVIGSIFVGGLGAGYFAALVDDEPLRSSDEMVQAIFNYEETSEIYFADNVFMGEVSSDLYREEISTNDVSSYIIDGIIATEDEYFKEHNGIVPKAIMRAMFQELTDAATQTGGSTLTQQIIKNQILTNEVSFDRKAKEIILAMRLEHFLDKDDILEAYLNIVPFGRNANGRNIAGVQTAAQGIFGVDASEVNLAQAAFIAGLPQSPIAYSPFTNSGQVKSEEGLEPGLNRMETVLNRMLNQGMITEREREEALSFDLIESFTTRSPSTFEQYPYLTEEIRRRTEQIFIERLALEDGYTIEELESNSELMDQYTIHARREISQGGYQIHTTIDKDIYDVFQEVTANYDNYGPNKIAVNRGTDEVIMRENDETGELEPYNAPVQAGGILRDNETGAILAFVGGRDFDTQNRNFATNARRQLGSTAKPTFVYGPAFEEGILQPGSVIADVETHYADGSAEGWSPTNFTRSRYYGLTTIRTALRQSYNVTAARAYIDLLDVANPIPDYVLRMGYTNYAESTYRHASNALGAAEATLEENTNAYSTFGNGGTYAEGYMIERIVSSEGEAVYEHETHSEDIFSAETSYLILDILRDVLSSGTGTAARASLSNPNVDWAGKTGTTNQVRDTWFIATNPNVTLGTWMGYEYGQELNTGYSGRNQQFWAALVNAATEINPELMAPSGNFERPNNIVSRSFSLVSGMQPSSLTEAIGLVGNDLFNTQHVPDEEDYSIISADIVNVGSGGVLIGSQTPEEFTSSGGYIFNPEWLRDMGYDELEDLEQLYPSREGGWANLHLPDLNEVEDSGNRPNPPTQVSKSGNILTWNASNSENVIGYRIYRAADPDSNFSLFESTIDTQLNVGNSPAVYQIRAVDYFGRESEPTRPFIDGNFEEEEEEEEEEPEVIEEPEEEDEEEEEEEEPDDDDDDDDDDD